MATTNLEKKEPLSESAQWMRWGNYHRGLFGWKSDAEVEMISMWIGNFRRRHKYTPEECFKATETIAGSTHITYSREHHLPLIHQAIRELRRSRAMRKQDDDQKGQCSYCYNSGLVTVPWLPDVDGMDWISNRTCGVWCSCSAGYRYSSIFIDEGRKPLMGLPEYKTRNVSWQRQMRDRFERDFEDATLMTHARSVSGSHAPALDKILNNIKLRFGLLPPEEKL